MKIKLLSAIFILSLFIAKAQDDIILHCAQSEVMTNLKKLYPDIEQKMQQKNEMLVEQAKNFDMNSYAKTNATIIVPVVVHVIYNTTAQNISDAQVKSQIDVLNKDFSRTNADASSTPTAFQSLAGKTDFYFCLATVDPNGNPTTGIERIQTSATSFQPATTDVKFTSSGGADAWPPKKYLNIWVCNIANNVGGWGESAASVDPQPTMGAVLQYNVFGTTGTLQNAYNKGRSTTHEVGHVFDLVHIWGPDNSTVCTDDDYVTDTPKQAGVNFGACPSFPKTDACTTTSPGLMYMNYMDYTFDACKNMFSVGQCARMLLSYNNSQTPWQTSGSCSMASINEKDKFEHKFNLYPNPSNGIVNIGFNDITPVNYTITIQNSIGQILYKLNLNGSYQNNAVVNMNDFTNGLYVISISTSENSYRTNFCLSK